MMKNSKVDWLESLGEYSTKGYGLQYNKDFYDMLGIINITVPADDKENEYYKLYRSELQENNISEELYCEVQKSGKVFLNAIKSIGADDVDYYKIRPRDDEFVMYNNIRQDEQGYWKTFLDELNIEYYIEEYAYCWWSDDMLSDYKSVWVNEEQFKSIENSEKYITALKNLHGSIQKHLIAKENKYGSLSEKQERQEAFKRGMEKLDSLVGLTEIKSILKETIAHASFVQRAKGLGMKISEETSNHIILTGNPGTGKTVVARALAEIYYGMGVLKTNTFIETNKTELIGAYVGHTEKNIEKVFNAVIQAGGMIFVDEFHQFYDGSDWKGFGNKAIESMVPYLENDRDKFVFVAAGYPEQMKRALEHDPGLEQRIPWKVKFPDYSNPEVFEIFQNLCSQNDMDISEKESKKMLDMFMKLPSGGNGRMARDIYEHSILKKALRIFQMGNISDEQFKKEYSAITIDDVNNSIKSVIPKYSKTDTKSQTKAIGFTTTKDDSLSLSIN